MTKPYLRIVMKSGHTLELGAKCLGDKHWTVFGHWKQILKAKKAADIYEMDEGFLDTNEISAVVYME